MQSMAQPNTLERRLGESPPLAPGKPAIEQAGGHVIERAQAVQQEELLEDKADMCGSQGRDASISQPVYLIA
jgi:hypothetical protein